MKDILGIGEAVYDLLGNDATVTALVGDGIYPIVADEGVDFPFIIYRRDDVSYDDSKDGIYGQEAVVEVACVDETYHGAVSVALAVRDCLSSFRGAVSGYDIDNVSLSSSSEDFIDNAFVQTLKFTIEI